MRRLASGAVALAAAGLFLVAGCDTPTSGPADLSAPEAQPSHSGACDIVVDDDDGESIQADGIDVASAGDAICVEPGTYTERLTVDKSLTLTGDPGKGSVAGPGPNAPVLDGQNTTDGHAIRIETGVSDVTVEGFHITDYAGNQFTGIGVVGSGAPAIDNVTVRDNKFTDLGWEAVLAWSSGSSVHSGWEVSRNVVDGMGVYGLELTNCSDCTLRWNEVTTVGVNGLMINAWAADASGTMVANNEVSTASVGIYTLAWQGSGATLEDLSVVRNDVSNVGVGLLAWGYTGSGFEGEQLRPSLVRNVVNCGKGGSGTGISLVGDVVNAKLINNDITQCSTKIDDNGDGTKLPEPFDSNS